MTILSASACVLLVAVVPGPPAAAGDLEDKRAEREEVDDELDDAREDLNQATEALDEATEAYEDAEAKLPSAEQALEQAEAELAAARDELAQAEGELAAAKAEDARAAERLSAAEQRVRDQLAKIDALNLEIEGQEADMSQLASATYRRGSLGRLPEVAAVLSAPTLGEATRRIGYARSIMTADGVELTGMQQTRAELANERIRLDELRDQAEQARIEAAEQLERTEELEAAAQQAADEATQREAEAREAKEAVDELIREREQAMAAAEDAREADEQAYAELQAERERIDEEIKELARKREKERERREAEERERREAEERASRDDSSGDSESGESNESSGSGSSGDSSGASASSSPLAYPVSNPYVTSSYGMRVHPITGVYKLHDGTDFRAYCGTPIRAAQDGRVEWAYYRGGYGNQVLIDHGNVQGTNLMTSYSHLSRFAVGSGAWVSQGQVIGYSGTTGYSTACHLHLMVYAGGTRTNPMNYL